MYIELDKTYKYVLSEARCYFRMAQNPNNPCQKEDCFHAAVAAGKADIIARILEKEWCHTTNRTSETGELIRAIRDYWEETL